MSQQVQINLPTVRDVWQACYPEQRLKKLFGEDRNYSPFEVLTRTDGPWFDVSAQHRLWVVLHRGVLSDRVLRLLACEIGLVLVEKVRRQGGKIHTESMTAFAIANHYANGDATIDELNHARSDAERAHKIEFDKGWENRSNSFVTATAVLATNIDPLHAARAASIYVEPDKVLTVAVNLLNQNQDRNVKAGAA